MERKKRRYIIVPPNIMMMIENQRTCNNCKKLNCNKKCPCGVYYCGNECQKKDWKEGHKDNHKIKKELNKIYKNYNNNFIINKIQKFTDEYYKENKEKKKID